MSSCTFTFTPTADVPVDVLSAKSTYAKVKIEPIDAFVDATISSVQSGAHWKVFVPNVPQATTVPLQDHKAILSLTTGEFGKHLGNIDLGNLH
jgi:hypothetical protein